MTPGIIDPRILAGLDALVMALLLATIIFAFRLSRQLSAFRAERDAMRSVVHELAGSVAKAEQAITGLKNTAQITGRDLQARIDVARSLSEELQLIAEAEGNRDARRAKMKPPEKTAMPRPAVRPEPQKAETGGFAIRDRDTERGEAPDEGGFLSQAERDLHEAMRGRRDAGGR